MNWKSMFERFVAWILRNRVNEPTPITLVQRRIGVFPTPTGFAFGLGLMVMHIWSINYNLSLGYALVFMYAGIGLVNIIHAFRNLVGLEIERGQCAPVFVSELAHFGLQITNRRDAARHVLNITLPNISNATVHIQGNTVASVALAHPTHRRGWLQAPRITIQTSYPLGLISAWSYIQPDLRVLVYPQPAYLAPPLPQSASAAYGTLTKQKGKEDFSGLRNHQPTDPWRHVAWKAVARRDNELPLLTKEYSGSGYPPVMLDFDATPASLHIEERIAILSRWVMDCAQADLAWGLRLPHQEIPLGNGQSHREACLAALALFPSSAATEL